ncbi:spectrin beta chain, non-erythrocytic 1 isoform X5 [Polypterus senegalus]|uniref:spectrin beta chain, non-erythrocytic 1 isoform X5 n=1 Tax=Polypterus senegalus TaxID=55291 RepID=UPI00196346D5|nr:spectrin beta chain, non-erythrocytic 1 isoform X5 [Polypterus senegalus]
MSESFVRKIQPFTIGTKLSVPTVSKCTEFTNTYLPDPELDNCNLRHNLNEKIPLYLGNRELHTETSHFSPVANRLLQVDRSQEEISEEDHENSNGAAQATSSRSIRKITISSGLEKALDKVASSPKMTITKPENINNNNNACRVLPRIVGVSCENKPNSQFKVLLRKESVDEEQNVAGSPSSPASWHTTDTATPHHLIPLSSPLLSKKEPSKIDNSATGDEVNNSPTVARQQNDCSLTQRTAQFNKELSQAETWIRRKLQDLKDGSNIQRYPLQDWEQISQTLQRELKDFENTLIQLNQMGEQLISKQNPMSEMVRKQLNQLKEQWQILKLTAANQSKAVGSAKNLQEFNRKVDKLEDWIKEKEEKKCLALLLEDNIDKIQLTRKILDLKQDEQQYRALHDEINSMALKLEKQGKNEGKNISTRRKHINKMWLKAQALIKDHHENLQLALEASSFYQQADTIIRTANAKRKCISSSSGQENSTDRDMRDIASQIMMLDVTVSQLSNLHPILAARVTQKQKEVKDSWVLLQQAVRNEKSNLQSSCSDFTREAGDPLTSTRESQCSVGKEAHRIMGKEVKEEQNRLKGCVISSLGVREPGTNRKSIKSQDEEQLSKPITETGSNPNETDDVTDRRQTEGGRKKKNDTKAASLRENSQVHIQLQKFTISADKTLLWLKDNVAMATKICCTENQDGLESAKRCQAALEDEIISNSSRIELVKKEGRSLVRAQHPGSAKIEEFLGQLEVLWEELIKRHQKNDILLEESERLNIKSFKVQKDMNDLGQWLKTVESSISSDTPLSGDPESMSAAERESSLLKVEVVSRGMELRALKQEVEKLRHRRHYLAEKLQSQMGQLEDIYLSVLSALKQQTSELQDTRMLTEFLEKVQREENQIQKRSLDKSQHRDTTLPESCPLPLVEVDPHFIDSGRFDSDNIADPMEELREAVEMLNDTVRERGMSLTEELEIEDLFILHSNISLRISQLMSKNRELCAEIPKVETEMAVKCKPDLCALENLTNQQEDMEIDYEVVKEEVEELENQTIRFETLRAHALEEEVRRTLKAWEDLGTIIAESRERLNQARLLQDFFRNYLAMISWTEETRSCIFSENAAKLAEVGQTAMTKELDIKIEQKFQEFEELAAAGQKLINEDHHLTMVIKERTDELRSMLGWILVRWKTQKHHLNHGKRKSEPKGDIIYSEAMVSGIPLPDQQEEKQDSGERPMGCQLKLHEEQRMLISSNQTENCYEEMASISQRPGNVKLSAASGSQPLSTDAHDSPLLVLKESSTSSLGGTVNLIFSFNKTADSHLQVTDSMDETEVREPIHRPCDSKSSGCKNFWKRCQGLLENTFGSLKRKTKISRQNAEEDHSLSLLSVHMGLENNGKEPLASDTKDYENMEQMEALESRGLSDIMNGRRLVFQSMEGTLERKHMLQFGGKKAASRTWNTYHAVLFKQTLCFYQDRKDTLRSCIAGMPLNLTGAVCSPAPDYTKKMNCFLLQLRDGSEYLLSAPSRFLMKKWILKIQANTGVCLMDSSRPITGCLATADVKSIESYASSSTSSVPQESSNSSFPEQSLAVSSRAKEITVLTRENVRLPSCLGSHMQELSTPLSTDRSHQGDYYGSLRQAMKQKLSQRSKETCHLPEEEYYADIDTDLMINKRRSHSFTSAAYQKITPVSMPFGKAEGGSSYSVTLFIGDHLTEVPSRQCQTILNSPPQAVPQEVHLPEWHPEFHLHRPSNRNYGSLPRARNKSVFKKFFGKKE